MASIDETVSSQVAEYLLQRASLIAEEKEQRHDYAFRQRLSPTAKRAASIVQHIRAHEAATVWTKEVEDDEGDVYPGMMFTLAKDRMEGTRLWKIVKRMPKGCLLHSHLEAMVDMSWLLNLALETPGMYLFSDTPLSSPAALQSASIQFVYSAPTPYPVDIYSPSYPSGTLVSMVSAAESFPFPSGDNTLPPTERFLLWLTARTTVTAAESLKHHEGINQIWRKFQSIFSIIQGIIYYEPIYREFVRHILHHLHLDQVLWVDLRIAFVMTLRAADTGELLPRSDVVRIFEEEVRRYKESPEGRGFWGARVIWTTIRIFESAAVRESMQECIDAAKKYPSVIAGFDLVGQEDLGRPQLEHVPDLLWFRSTCTSLNLTLPFYFHAGETLGDGTSTDNNLFDALLLGSVRIGHGFSLYKHPLLLRLCRERNICVEVCPVSNEILRLTSSICSHPLPALLAHGVPVALCNDDPGLLGTAGVTHDFWQVVQAFENVGLEGVGDLAETSVRFAAFERERERERRMGEWRGSWERFCEWVVVNFGEWEEDGEGVGEVVVLA